MRHGLPIVEVQIPKHVLEIGLFEEKYNLCASCNDGFALTILEHNVAVLKGAVISKGVQNTFFAVQGLLSAVFRETR